MNALAPWQVVLSRVEKRRRPSLLRQHQIHCQIGEWDRAVFLKLQKKSWSDHGFQEGVFFSVWICERDLTKNRFSYNIHALKLRLRKGYTIKPREFASTFRAKFRKTKLQWPNLNFDYGPQTLMQGWLELNAGTFERDVLRLLDHFVAVHLLIDEMLDERKKV